MLHSALWLQQQRQFKAQTQINAIPSVVMQAIWDLLIEKTLLIIVTVFTSTMPAALQKFLIYTVVLVDISIASNKLSSDIKHAINDKYFKKYFKTVVLQ